MAVTIELNPRLAELAGGVHQVEVEAGTIQDAVVALAKLHRPIGARIFNCEGGLRSVVKVELNGKPEPADHAGEIPVAEGDVLKISMG